MTVYLDSSALVKLIQVEAETAALRAFLADRRGQARVTSALARVEVVRAVIRADRTATRQARRLLARLHEVALDRPLLDRAGALTIDSPLRSLDAIHLASALTLGSTLDAVVTYDVRMADAANELGLPVERPG